LTAGSDPATVLLMLDVIYPGTFDPPTNGHMDIILRAARIFGRIAIVIANHPHKDCFFETEERKELMEQLVSDIPNVEIHVWDGLIVSFAEKVGINVILRGVRALTDFDYEFELCLLYKSLNPGIETILLPTDKKYLVLRSSVIKEIASLGGDVSDMVPPAVEKALREKLQKA